MEPLVVVLALWFCSTGFVSGVTYNLTHTRTGNNFTLTCDSRNVSAHSADVKFWINRTEQIDIAKTLKVSLHEENLIFFELVPQYEGTFYCGESDGEWSNGIGPFVADPNYYSPNNRSYKHRINLLDIPSDWAILQCPLQLGSLIQAYEVTWVFINTSNDSVLLSELLVIKAIDNNLHPILHIFDDKKNIGRYTCIVNVTDFYDGQVSTISRNLFVLYDNTSDIIFKVSIGISTFVFLCLIVFAMVICYHCCRRRSSRYLSKVSIENLRTQQHCDERIQLVNERRSSPKPPYSSASKFRDQAPGERIQLPANKRRSSPKPPASEFRGQFKHKHLKITSSHSIGSGAFGTIFKVEYKGRTCAMKLLKNHAQELATGLDCTTDTIQKVVRKSFLKECKFLTLLSHKNIVTHFHTCIDPKSNLPMLIMELMDCSLKAYLKGHKSTSLSYQCQTSLCLDVAEGLEYIHSQNIIHRDLCDDNVLLRTSNGAIPIAKIADFGMSRLFHRDYMSATLTGLGHREAYFPAEVREDPYHYSAKIDVFSFGVIATQIIMVETPVKTEDDVSRLTMKIPDSDQLKSMILKCLCEDQNTRLDSAQVVGYIKSYTLHAPSSHAPSSHAPSSIHLDTFV